MPNQPVIYSSSAIATSGTIERVAVLDDIVTELAEPDLLRLSFSIYNEEGILFVALGENDAAPNNYTYRLTRNCILDQVNWKGRITCIKELGDSAIQFTIFRIEGAY